MIHCSENTLIWGDLCVPDLPNFKPVSKSHDNRNSCLVISQLLRQDKLGWDEEELNSLFDGLSAKAIQRLPVRPRELLDTWYWANTPNGKHSVKAVFWNRIEHIGRNWTSDSKASKIHDMFKMLLWRVAINILPTKDKIQSFKPDIDRTCPLCGVTDETPLHSFVQCQFAKAIWFSKNWSIRPDQWNLSSTAHLVDLIMTHTTPPPPELVVIPQEKVALQVFGALAIDQIWRSRNAVIFEGAKIDMKII